MLWTFCPVSGEGLLASQIREVPASAKVCARAESSSNAVAS